MPLLLLISLLLLPATTSASPHSTPTAKQQPASPTSDAGAAYEAIGRLHAHLEDARSAWADDDLMRAACARRPPGLPDFARRLLGDPNGADRLWRAWLSSAAAAWTPEEVVQWAEPLLLTPTAVQRRRHPIRLGLAGVHLPLLTEPDSAAAAPLLIGLEAEERRRLAARATELVLFGPNRTAPSMVQHLVLATLGIFGLGGVWLVCMQKKFFEDNRRLFAGRSSHLVHAEKSLADLQEKLASAEQQSARAAEEKQRLEEVYKREIARLKDRAWRLSHERLRSVGEADAAAQLALAEQEVAQLRALLEQSAASPADVGVRAVGPPASAELLHLLRLCHETELRYCSANRLKAEEQLARASESLQKLLRKQYTVMGVFRSALSMSDMINHVEKEIVTAKDFADKVKLDIQERIQRWTRVEELMGVEIIPKQETPLMSLRTYDNIRSYAVRWKLKTAADTSMRRMAMQNAAASAANSSSGSANSLSAGTSAATALEAAAPAATGAAASAAPIATDNARKEELANQFNSPPAKRASVSSISLEKILADSKQALREAETSELRRRSQPCLQSPLAANENVVFSVPQERAAEDTQREADKAEAGAETEPDAGAGTEQPTELTAGQVSGSTASLETASVATAALTTNASAKSGPVAKSASVPTSSTMGRKRRSLKLLKYFGSSGGSKLRNSSQQGNGSG